MATIGESDYKRVALNQMRKRLTEDKKMAFLKAIDSLSRYKFMMFGYWSAIWIHLNNIDEKKEHNPFKVFVEEAREIVKQFYKEGD